MDSLIPITIPELPQVVPTIDDILIISQGGETKGTVLNNFSTLFKGEKGEKGDIGSTPVVGVNNNWFIDGVDTGILAIGIQGIQGLKGDKGDQGIQGEQGIQGIQGDTGATGDQGIQGLKGDTGLTDTEVTAINTHLENTGIHASYSNGAWNPSLAGSTVAGIYTYSPMSGYYSCVGKQVTVWFKSTISAIGDTAGSGLLKLKGLPITPDYAISYPCVRYGGILVLFENISLDVGYTDIVAIVKQDGVYLYQYSTGMPLIPLDASKLVVNSTIEGCLIYKSSV